MQTGLLSGGLSATQRGLILSLTTVFMHKVIRLGALYSQHTGYSEVRASAILMAMKICVIHPEYGIGEELKELLDEVTDTGVLAVLEGSKETREAVLGMYPVGQAIVDDNPGCASKHAQTVLALLLNASGGGETTETSEREEEEEEEGETHGEECVLCSAFDTVDGMWQNWVPSGVWEVTINRAIEKAVRAH